MTGLKRWVPLVGAAFILSLGLAACGEGTAPDQQSQNPVSEQSGDAAATVESETQPLTSE